METRRLLLLGDTLQPQRSSNSPAEAVDPGFNGLESFFPVSSSPSMTSFITIPSLFLIFLCCFPPYLRDSPEETNPQPFRKFLSLKTLIVAAKLYFMFRLRLFTAA